MKAVVLAGCLGNRLSEAVALRPRPRVEIGGSQLVRSIMKNGSGRWQPTDTVRDNPALQAPWNSGPGPWKVWK